MCNSGEGGGDALSDAGGRQLLFKFQVLVLYFIQQ